MNAGVLVDNEFLWARYKQRSDAGARDALIQSYLPWAASVAHSIHRRLRFSYHHREDFVQNALIGLPEAISRFDPDRGIAFEAYAKSRVRGSIFNGIRAIAATHKARPDRFEHRLEAIGEADESSGDAFERLFEAVSELGLGYLIEDSMHFVAQYKPIDAFSNAVRFETSRRVLNAVSSLSDRSRKIIEDHYFKDVPFIEIAKGLGLTKGRISQLHTKALTEMRALVVDPVTMTFGKPPP